MNNINEILNDNNKFYPIKSFNVQHNFKVNNVDRFLYYFNTDSGLQYRISIILIPSSLKLENFILGKYYPNAAKFVDKITKKDQNIFIATLTFAVYSNEQEDYIDKTVTNQGMIEYLKILQTCIKLLKDFINKHSKIKVLYFSGAFKKDENPDRLTNISQRTSIMKSIIQRFIIPGWNSKQFSNLIILYKK